MSNLTWYQHIAATALPGLDDLDRGRRYRLRDQSWRRLNTFSLANVNVTKERRVWYHITFSIPKRNSSIASPDGVDRTYIVTYFRLWSSVSCINHNLQHCKVPVFDYPRKLLVPLWIEPVAMLNRRCDFLSIKGVPNNLNNHKGIYQVAFICDLSFRIHKLLPANKLNGKLVNLLFSSGSRTRRSPHVFRLQHITTFAILHESAIVYPQWFSWRLDIQRSHLNAMNPSQHWVVVWWIETGALRVYSRKVRHIVNK